MRGFWVAIACIAAVAGAGGIRADVIGTRVGGISPFAAGAAIPQTMVRGNPFGLPKPRENAVRLAQLAGPVHSGNPSVAPLKWVGMLITPTPTQSHPDSAAYCTAQFIKPNVVLTAGHCVKDIPADPGDPGLDLTKQIFVLQYQNGEGSHTFKTKCAAASPQWAFPSNYKSLTGPQKYAAFLSAHQHDFAMVLVDGDSPTGVMPYQLDWKGKFNGATRIGYAADILDGKIIQDSHGIVFFADSIPMFPDSFPNLVVNWQSLTNLTSGTSGGAWIANFSTTEAADKNTLIAVNSFHNTDFPGAEVGAYLTAAEFDPLLTFVSNGCK